MIEPGSVTIKDRTSAVEAIKRLGEDDLLFLNKLIVERLKLIHQTRHANQMLEFTKGDRVSFQTSEGKTMEGVVKRLNKKTVSVIVDCGHQWNVSPSLLTLVKSAELPGLGRM